MKFLREILFILLPSIILSAVAFTVPADATELGTNDFRLSDMGPDGDINFEAASPAVAYNSTNNEYLVVWAGDDNTGALVNNEAEIFGQRIDAATGAEIGSDFRLSDMGPDGNATFDASSPAVAYNPTNNEYLVVWSGSDNTGALISDEFEIFGQRIDAATGTEVGTNDFRLSDMGPDGNFNFSAFAPAVAYNPTNNEYLVVWTGDDNTAPLVDNENEIFGQRIDAATGAEVGTNDFRLSDMGPNGGTSFGASAPAVAYNSTNNEYLVVWEGDDDTAPLVDNESEIFGQRIDAATGAEVGTNDFRLSDMGPDGNANFDALNPAVAYNPTHNEYLAVWEGEDNTGTLIDEEFEIFGQRINAATGAEVGTNDFRLSDMGTTDGSTSFGAFEPAVTYNSRDNQYLAVWQGDDDASPLVDEEIEIFGQRIDAATGAEVGTNDLRLSDMGPVGDANFNASTSAVAYNVTNNEYLAVWKADDGPPLVNFEFEIFGQRFAEAVCGNGFLETFGGEGCDDGNSDNTDACLDTCVAASCGDGFVRSGVEQCDDGNATSGDGCSSACETEASGGGGGSGSEAVCGNGAVEGSEECDDGNTTAGDGCSASCANEPSVAPACGDGTLQTGEDCDDGNTTAGDGCSATCVTESGGEPAGGGGGGCSLIPS